MNLDLDTTVASLETAQRSTLSPWRTPTVEDADIGALTEGGGTSGIEGTPFLKTGS